MGNETSTFVIKKAKSFKENAGCGLLQERVIRTSFFSSFYISKDILKHATKLC